MLMILYMVLIIILPYLHNINFKIKLTLVLNNFNDLKGLEVANNVCKK